MNRNMIRKILFYGGIAIIIAGLYPSFSHSFQFGNVYEYNFESGVEEPVERFDFSFFLQFYITYFMYGMVLIWFSEMIRLLELLVGRRQLQISAPNGNEVTAGQEDGEQPAASRRRTVGKQEEEMIHDLYADHAILEIQPSHTDGYLIVRLQDYQGPPQSYLRVVETKGFRAEEVKDKKLADEIIAEYETGK